MKKTMFSRVAAYLAWRRSLGYKLRIEGQMLENFALYADRSKHRGLGFALGSIAKRS
jgi:hypothetical protein